MRTTTPVGPPPQRTRRFEERRRRRTGAWVVSIGALALAFLAWSLLLGGGGAGHPAPPATPPATTSTVLAVRSGPQPLVAVIVTGEAPAVVALPPRLELEISGQGQGTTSDLVELPGDSLRVALANTFGAWIAHYAVTDLPHLAEVVDRGGGLPVSLPKTLELGAATVGPGAVSLTGKEVRAYLSLDGPLALTRWEVVLQALLADPPALQEVDLLETDDATAVARALGSARGAGIVGFPSHVVAGRLLVPSYDALDALAQRSFGVAAPPTPVAVENDSGAPGVGEIVARLLVPAGFRVVASFNAQRFSDRPTEVVAMGRDHVAVAQRAREALGVGTVAVTRVPSGVADVTVVVGKDLTS